MKQDNQRVIKFRAWDEEYKWFDNVVAANLLSQIHDLDQDVDKEYGKRFFLSQFTGLKDKNGKEIYEGDIVNQENWVKVGTYVKAIGVVKYIGVEFTCDCINDWEGSNADLNGNAEIIGNIYENSNLLNK